MPNEGVVFPEESKYSGYRSEGPAVLVRPILQFLPNIREKEDAIKRRRIPRLVAVGSSPRANPSELPRRPW
jgi:hypothetical protein